MPIPRAAEAVVAAQKVRDYLLNPEHPEGGSKAAWFQSLGYKRDGWSRLATDFLEIARGATKFSIEPTQFGVKYVVRGKVRCGSVRAGTVLTVWIIEGDKPPRLVTAYPDDEP